MLHREPEREMPPQKARCSRKKLHGVPVKLKPDAAPSREMPVMVIAPPVAFCNERETLSAPPVETTLPPLTIICLLSELKFTLAEEGDTTKISTPIMVTTSKNAQP